MNKNKKIGNKIKRTAFKAIKPFLPFIIIIIGLFFAICTIIDAIFIQEVQTDTSMMSEVEAELKEKCIEKAEYLNTCNNFIGSEESTNYLLDIESRETDKEIEWSHLYAIMAFHNMSYGTNLDEDLLNEVAGNFESTFIYERITVQTETTTVDENGNTNTTITEETAYILIESDTIIGHYKYNYEETTTTNGNIKITGKSFVSEELIGEKYERLKTYLQDKLNISDDDLDTDVSIVIEAANGYYDGEENTSWLQNSSNNTIITDGESLVPTRNVYMANSWIYNDNIFLWNESTSNNSEHINYIQAQMYRLQSVQILWQWQMVQ